MNLFSKIALAGVGTVALAGSALAAERAMHVMNVNLPDGSVAHVRYIGDVPPKVELVPVARAVPVALIDPALIDPNVAFAGFDRMFADFDRQQAALMQHVAGMQQQVAAPASGKLDRASVSGAPAGGTVSYSFTSYSSGGDGKSGGCTQSYQMTSYGTAQPKVVSQSTGDCSKAAKFGTAPTPVKAPAPAPQPKTVPHDAV
jgi:hypothetical protein